MLYCTPTRENLGYDNEEWQTPISFPLHVISTLSPPPPCLIPSHDSFFSLHTFFCFTVGRERGIPRTSPSDNLCVWGHNLKEKRGSHRVRKGKFLSSLVNVHISLSMRMRRQSCTCWKLFVFLLSRPIERRSQRKSRPNSRRRNKKS